MFLGFYIYSSLLPFFQACRVARIGSIFKTVGYAGPGIDNADFVLFVSATHEERCTVGSAVAYAAYCQLEGALDRYRNINNLLTCLAALIVIIIYYLDVSLVTYNGTFCICV